MKHCIHKVTRGNAKGKLFNVPEDKIFHIHLLHDCIVVFNSNNLSLVINDIGIYGNVDNWI